MSLFWSAMAVGIICAITAFLGLRLWEVTAERDALREEKEEVPVSEERPPLGLCPRHIWEMQRLQLLGEAIERYTDAQKQVPEEWFAEHEELRNKLKPYLGKL